MKFFGTRGFWIINLLKYERKVSEWNDAFLYFITYFSFSIGISVAAQGHIWMSGVSERAFWCILIIRTFHSIIWHNCQWDLKVLRLLSDNYFANTAYGQGGTSNVQGQQIHWNDNVLFQEGSAPRNGAIDRVRNSSEKLSENYLQSSKKAL